jgi:hypothetical protein
MTFADLTNGQVVRYRTGRAGRHDVDWNPWIEGPIYVMRRVTDLPKRLWNRSRAPRAGQIITLTVPDSADFSESDYTSAFNVFTAEDYYLEIEGLTL